MWRAEPAIHVGANAAAMIEMVLLMTRRTAIKVGDS
jgi:hypothetical protein